jgi:hypothetical protein
MGASAPLCLNFPSPACPSDKEVMKMYANMEILTAENQRKQRKASFSASFVLYGSHTEWPEIETLTPQRYAGV